MRRILASDVLKIFLYVAGVLVLGAALAPVIYNLGKGLAETAADKQTAAPIEWLADAARRSSFPRFFDRAVLLAGIILLFPLFAALRLGKKRRLETGLSATAPRDAELPGQPLKKNPHGWVQMLSGTLVAAGLLLLSGWVMVQAGLFVWRDAPTSTTGVPNKYVEAIQWGKAIRKVIPTAAVTSVLEEVLFRGVLLGIFLRAMKPFPAIALLSFLFAFVHFLEPPPGVVIASPDALDSGFVMLGHIFSRYADPLSLLSRFMVLMAVGLVLAHARYRTASLWLPIGLHAGWIFGYAVFKAATHPVPLSPALQWLVGKTLLEGLLPLSIVILTGFTVQFLARRQPHEDF